MPALQAEAAWQKADQDKRRIHQEDEEEAADWNKKVRIASQENKAAAARFASLKAEYEVSIPL